MKKTLLALSLAISLAHAEEEKAPPAPVEQAPPTDRRMIGVAGASISLDYLSKLLSHIKIGKSGEVIILNAGGEIIASPHLVGAHAKGGEEAVETKRAELTPIAKFDEEFAVGFNNFLLTRKEGSSFKLNGITYLAAFSPFVAPTGEEWLVGIIVPENDFLEEVVSTMRNLLIILTSIALVAGLLVALFSKRISKPISELAGEFDKIKHLDLEGGIAIKSGIKELRVAVTALGAMKSTLRSFGRYVPKELVRRLLETGHEIRLGGEKKEISIFFSDIVNFTTVSERMPAESLMLHLSDFFDALSTIILANKGTIDKYIGDSIMAFWGAPEDLPDHAIFACHSALLCQQKLIELNKKWAEEDKPILETRIGLNTGRVIVGNIGTSERMNYTIIGDAVNLASRLEGINKIYHTKIILGEELYKKIGKRFLTRPLDVVAVKGKDKPVKIYELIAEIDGDPTLAPTQEQRDFCAAFEKAFDTFHAQKWAEAAPLFDELHKHYPDDYSTGFYLEKSTEYIKTPPKEWKGITKIETK